MENDSLDAGINRINSELTNGEKEALMAFSNCEDQNNLIFLLFQEIKRTTTENLPFFHSPQWCRLTPKHKLALSTKIRSWYLTLLMFDPDFADDCNLTQKDYEQLSLIATYENLCTVEDAMSFLDSLYKALESEGWKTQSSDHISLLEQLIKQTKEGAWKRHANLDYIFPEATMKVLQDFYEEFGTEIFESSDTDEFKRMFIRIGGSKPRIKDARLRLFCYSISFVDDNHSAGDLDKWFEDNLHINYKQNKKPPLKNQQLIRRIESFFANNGFLSNSRVSRRLSKQL